MSTVIKGESRLASVCPRFLNAAVKAGLNEDMHFKNRSKMEVYKLSHVSMSKDFFFFVPQQLNVYAVQANASSEFMDILLTIHITLK